MSEFADAADLTGTTLRGPENELLGTIVDVYPGAPGGAVTFAVVNVGMSGAETVFVPLADAALVGNDVTVPYGVDLVAAAPAIDTSSGLGQNDLQRLYEHYGVTANEVDEQDHDGRSEAVEQDHNHRPEVVEQDQDSSGLDNAWDDGDHD